MPAFRFDDAKPFDANWDAFMAEMRSLDPDMAALLEANKGAVAAIVRHGERDSGSRSRFNAAIAVALDKLVASANGAS
jgi:hypothetical protein